MTTSKFRQILSASVAVSAALSISLASAADATDGTHVGRSSVYSNLQNNTLEDVSTQDDLLKLLTTRDANGKVVTVGEADFAPTKFWTMLEHGERMECLACIPHVSKMIYASNPKTREISAWWLRRRIFGVFGKGEAYEQIVNTVSDSSATPLKRAYAANALGEFLEGAGIPPVSQALVNDSSPAVRLAAANALIRLNNQGPNSELSTALSDSDESVRLAALDGATHINVFSHVDRVMKLISDSSAAVRRRAAQTLGTLRSPDSVVGLIALTSASTESDAGVRTAAVWALGQIGDAQAQDAVLAAQADTDSSVRDAANIALRRLVSR